VSYINNFLLPGSVFSRWLLPSSNPYRNQKRWKGRGQEKRW